MEILRAEVILEDSPYRLQCSTWSSGPISFTCKLNLPSGILMQGEIRAARRDELTQVDTLLLTITQQPVHVDTFVHALLAAAALPMFPFRHEASRLISLMKSPDTTQLMYAPHGMTLADVCRGACVAAATPIIPMLVKQCSVTEFVSSRWSVHVCQEYSTSLRDTTVVVACLPGPRDVLKFTFKAPEGSWSNPVNLKVTTSPRSTQAQQTHALTILTRNKHIKGFPYATLLKELAHQCVLTIP